MGIYSGTYLDVSNTQIYVSPSVDPYSNRQLVVYSTTIEVQYGPAFLCLPVPHPESIQFHTLKEDCSFFDSLERSFQPLPRYGVVENHSSVPTTTFGSPRILSSLASLVDIFDSKVLAQLEDIYKNLSIGFLLLELTPGLFRYSPLAYSHTMLHGRMFLPTLIYRARHPKDCCVQTKTNLWNHTLYKSGVATSIRDRFKLYPQPRLHEILWGQLPPAFGTPLVALVREKKEGFFENHDLSYKIHRASDENRRSLYTYPISLRPPPLPFPLQI